MKLKTCLSVISYRRAIVAFTTVAIMLALSGSAFAQSRLPFIGTRTFCGEHYYQLSSARDSDPKLKWETTTTVTIRANGFTTVKTNAYGPAYEDARRSTPYPYVTFSGKLTPGKANTMEKGEMRPAMAVCGPENCLWFSSANDIEVSLDWGVPDKAALCTSDAVPPQSSPTKQIAPEVLIANLYRQEEKVFQPRSRALLDKYFEKGLADLIWKQLLAWDEELDFDYVLHDFGGYGGDITSVSKPIIGKPTYDGQNAQVNVSEVVVCAPPVCPKRSVDKYTMIFLLAASETGWRITDIKYDCGFPAPSTATKFDGCVRGEKISLSEIYSRDSKAAAAGELPTRTNDGAGANLLISHVKLTPEDVKRLKAYVNPNSGEQCNFPDDPKILPQLELLLGKDLPHLEDNLGRNSGCQVDREWLRFDGFRPHIGGQEHGFVSINLNNGGLVAAILPIRNSRFMASAKRTTEIEACCLGH